MTSSIEAINRMQDKADCLEKEMYWKWMRAAEWQTAEAL
jgi:hypothetical protein